jgi:hypothetical protein
MPAHSISEPKCKFCGITLDWNEGFFGRICGECLRKLAEEEAERRDAERTIDDDFDDSDTEVTEERAPRADDKKTP